MHRFFFQYKIFFNIFLSIWSHENFQLQLISHNREGIQVSLLNNCFSKEEEVIQDHKIFWLQASHVDQDMGMFLLPKMFRRNGLNEARMTSWASTFQPSSHARGHQQTPSSEFQMQRTFYEAGKHFEPTLTYFEHFCFFQICHNSGAIYCQKWGKH